VIGATFRYPIEDRQLLVVKLVNPGRIPNGELPAGRFRIRIKVVLDRGRHASREVLVPEGRGDGRPAESEAKVIAETLNNADVEGVVPPNIREGRRVTEIEAFFLVIDVETKADLPDVRGPVRRERPAELLGFLTLLLADLGVEVHAIHPEIPRIVGRFGVELWPFLRHRVHHV